jgi:SWI/SNF-related matrix-associated actin-dependent regulator of chromatin subfamily D
LTFFQISDLIGQINASRFKREFMLAFSNDPAKFINQWVASQVRDMQVRILSAHFSRRNGLC